MIALRETKSGGDYNFLDDGIELDNSFETTGYIGLFGGNLKASTVTERKPLGAVYNDFWGNAGVINEPESLFNSEFERSLTENSINSGSIPVYEAAAETDLQFLVDKNYASGIEADVSIVSENSIVVGIDILQPSQSEAETLSFIWSETLERLENA